MIATWYTVVSFTLIAYIVLDGRNFGAGMLQWFVTKSPEERRQVIAAIGPLWTWHEVWLLGFGGTLIAIFPRLMASAFAGYYLALFLILWCLILRGISLEVGGHIDDRLWQGYWDFNFVLSNLLLAILFGAAAGNVARGVPIDAQGNFSMAFFTDFNVRGHVGLLDWYTVSIAILAVVMLAAHGATYLTLKTEGWVHDRSEKLAKYLWIAVVPLLLVVLIESRIVRPDLPGRALSNPFWWIGLVVVATSTITLISGLATRRELRAFVGSNFLIVGLLATGAAAIFPVMLKSTLAPENSLTAYAVASSPTTLLRASFWWPLAFALAVFYFVLISRSYAGKVSVQNNTESVMIYVHSLGRAARYFPERTALVASGKRSTFRELHARVGRIAAALTKHGFKAGDRLAILLPNEPDYIELVYACAWLGVIVVPLNTRLSVKEIDGILDDANPRGLIRHSSLPIPTVQVSSQLVLDQEPLDVQSDSIPDPIYDPNAILALIYTSGTTGRPKGVEIRHANILENVYHTNFWFPLEEGAVHLHAAPIFHIADFPFLFAAPAFGACQVTIPKFSPQTFCETVARERITHTVLVPTMINMLTQSPELQKYDLSTLRHLGYGGSPMAPELVHRTRQVLPKVKLVQVYGLSEAGFLTGLKDDEHTEDKLTSCGRPCMGIDVRVVDPTGKEVETGQTGELVARGANIMRSYWNKPEETKLAFRNGFFRTGDIGYQDANGYFYILDRLKDMIVTGGENVYSGEVEAVIYTHPAVREVAVFGIPDPKWGEIVKACVVLKPGKTLTADELIAYCRRSLANFKVPRSIEFSQTELPQSGSGKILKRVLRDAAWARQERAVA